MQQPKIMWFHAARPVTELARCIPWSVGWLLAVCSLTLGCTPIHPGVVGPSEVAGSVLREDSHKKLPDAARQATPSSEESDKVLPIHLDTVLRLAQDHNGQIQLAREKLNEAYINHELARKAWLPNFHVGSGYYHHEGGIQQPDGQLIRSSMGSTFSGLDLHGELDLKETAFRRIDAERKIWQQRGEVSRLTSETLLDAANTYFDLLTAVSAEAVSLELEENLQKTLDRAQKLAEIDPGASVEVERLKSQLLAQQRITWQFRKGARAASAKLAYLLRLDPCTLLAPIDPQLIAVRLIDGDVCAADLIAHAQMRGPGVREMEGLLALVHNSQAQSQGLGQLLPVLETRTLLGGFGAGPGSTLDWENRWESTIQARWNLTNLVTAREKELLAQSKMQQLHLSYEELRSKLALAIKEAYEESASSSEQIKLGKKQIERALEVYRLSESRFINQIKGASASEVLLALQSVAAARLDYLNAIRNFNKAQFRLMILTGQRADHE